MCYFCPDCSKLDVHAANLLACYTTQKLAVADATSASQLCSALDAFQECADQKTDHCYTLKIPYEAARDELMKIRETYCGTLGSANEIENLTPL
jgi:hypothetical protein